MSKNSFKDTTAYIRFDDACNTGHITLNRPEALNAINSEMLRDLFDRLLSWRDDPQIGYILLDHSGGRGFCAGGDIREIARSVADASPAIDIFPAMEFSMNVLIHGYPKPYISIMDGITMGAGLGISMYGSVRIATQNSVAAMPEINIGLYPDIGACWMLPRLCGALGRYMCLTGSSLSGRDVACAGIATHYAPPDLLDEVRSSLAAGDLSILERLPRPGLDELGFADQLPELERAFAHERVEEILQELGRRAFPLAEAAEHKMRHGAPRSVKLAARLMSLAATRADFAEHMRLEYRVVRRMLRAPDFTEGVRAVVIDKDKSPHWQPACLEEVDDADIESLFALHEDGVELS